MMTKPVQRNSLRFATRFRVTASVLAFAVGALVPAIPASAAESPVTITNDQFWHDTDGNPIFSQGGGIFDFPDPQTGVMTHYWYGVNYVEAGTYYNNPTRKVEWRSVDGRGFVSVDVYSSLDLKNWTFENSVLTETELNAMDGGKTGWFGRLGVTYVPGINKYAMLVQQNNETTGEGRLLALTSSSPTGRFTNPSRIDMKNFGTGFDSTGDQTVFVDDDGKGYLIYSKPEGRNRLFVAEIIGTPSGGVTLGRYQQVYSGTGREGNSMFKFNGKYYFTASDLHGWNASNAYYMVSDSIWGPYSPTSMTTMTHAANDYAHVTQTGFYYTLHGTEQDTVIFAGDRWADFAGNGLGYNQWTPLSFNGTTPVFNSLSSWNLDHTTGRWSVGAANNYVINPSFEADRVSVGTVRGWTYSGTTSAITNQSDNSGRVGNFHLAFSSSSTYSATASQNLAANPAIAPTAGTYTLTAWVRHNLTNANATARITVTSGTNSKSLDIKSTGSSSWSQVNLGNITLNGGAATISINTSNVPGGQWINVDDLTLTRTGTSSGDSYRLTARHSGLVVGVEAQSTSNEAEIKQYAWTGASSQRWRFEDAGRGYYRIINVNSGKCLDVSGRSREDDANVIQYTCGSGTNQQWQMVATSGGHFQLVARHSGKCLDVVAQGRTDGTDITQFTCGTGTNQQWARTTG